MKPFLAALLLAVSLLDSPGEDAELEKILVGSWSGSRHSVTEEEKREVSRWITERKADGTFRTDLLICYPEYKLFLTDAYSGSWKVLEGSYVETYESGAMAEWKIESAEPDKVALRFRMGSEWSERVDTETPFAGDETFLAPPAGYRESTFETIIGEMIEADEKASD